MYIIYIGDAGNVVNRIKSQHCSGNVEGSALRRHCAREMGFALEKKKRLSGRTRIRLDLPDPKLGEQKISTYIRAGKWKFVVCESYAEANDFQWYAIEVLAPVLNVTQKEWNKANKERLQTLLEQAEESPFRDYENLASQNTGPGVYLLFHENLPC